MQGQTNVFVTIWNHYFFFNLIAFFNLTSLKGCDRPEILYLFKIEVSQSIDDVIKDLGCEVAAKNKARDLKAAMADIVDNSPAVEEEGMADNDVIMG